MKKIITISRVAEILQNAKNVAIYTHINTDCDAVGSSLALREVLRGLGKTADVFVHSNFPSNFEVFGDLSFYNQKTTSSYDLAVCLDAANEARLGKYQYIYKKGTKNSLQIDHHNLSNDNYCNENYVVSASSTAEILFDVFKEMKVGFTPYVCRCLLAGIETDTGKFSFSVDSKTFKVAGELVEMGKIKMEEIVVPLFSSMKLETFSLLKIAYQKIELFSENHLAMIILNNDDFVMTNTTIDDTGGFVDIAMQIGSVKFLILASEDDKGYFRVSLRSKGDLSAKAVAEKFGGGGHLNASGCKIFGSADYVKQSLLDCALSELGWRK